MGDNYIKCIWKEGECRFRLVFYYFIFRGVSMFWFVFRLFGDLRDFLGYNIFRNMLFDCENKILL